MDDSRNRTNIFEIAVGKIGDGSSSFPSSTSASDSVNIIDYGGWDIEVDDQINGW